MIMIRIELCLIYTKQLKILGMAKAIGEHKYLVIRIIILQLNINNECSLTKTKVFVKQ